MGNIGDAISTTVPAVGSAGPTYAADINTILDEVKARLTARIPLSSILTNADLDLNGQALLNAAYVSMVPESATPGASPVNRYTTYGGNAWFVGPAGAVQITNGAGLNAAAIGGITGDYSGAGPMQFRYDAANTRYDAFSNQPSNTWAYIRARGFDIAGGASSAFRLRQLYAGSVNQTITWPAALPATQKVVQVDTAGNLVYSDLISGGGFDNRKKTYSTPLERAVYISGTSPSRVITGNAPGTSIAASSEVQFELPFNAGDRITSIEIYGNSTGTTTGVSLLQQRQITAATIAGSISGSFIGGPVARTFTPTVPHVMDNTFQDSTLYIRFTPPVGATFTVYSLTVTYDRPEA